jgi:HEAT repeat protein
MQYFLISVLTKVALQADRIYNSPDLGMVCLQVTWTEILDGVRMFYFRKLMAKSGFLGPLLSLMKLPDEKFRIEVVNCLAEIGHLRVVKPLCAALLDEEPSIRISAANGLGALTDPGSVDALRKALSDPEEQVRTSVTEALLKFDPPQSLWAHAHQLSVGDPSRRHESKEILLSQGPNAYLPLREALDSEDWRVRAGAAEVLGDLEDERAAKPLFLLLKDPDSDVRIVAAKALSNIKTPESSTRLHTLLTDNDENLAVRREAAQSLVSLNKNETDQPVGWFAGDKRQDITTEGLLGHVWMLTSEDKVGKEESIEILRQSKDRALEPLVGGLKATFAPLRLAAVSALGNLKLEGAVEPLIEALDDEDPVIRQSAAEALGELEDPRAFEALRACLKDKSLTVRTAVIHSLGRLKIDIPEEDEHNEAAREVSVEVLSSGSVFDGKIDQSRIASTLLESMVDQNETVRAAAAKALGFQKPDFAVVPLCKALKDLSDNVRASAAEALGKLRDERAVEPLIGALNDWYSTVCFAAAKSLLQFGKPTSLWGFAWLLGGGDEEESAKAEKIITEAASNAFEPLCAMLGDWHGEVRIAAAEALSRLGDARATKPLANELERRPLERKVVEAVFASFSVIRDDSSGREIAEAIGRGGYKFDERKQPKLLAEKIRELVKEGWLTDEGKKALRPVYMKLTKE